jgi:hypothetical protein
LDVPNVLFKPSMARSAPPVTPVVAVADDIGAVAADHRLTASTGQAGSLPAGRLPKAGDRAQNGPVVGSCVRPSDHH